MRRGTSIREESSRFTETPSMSSSTRPMDGPRCKCGLIMVRFIAKRGLNIGREFWRCPCWKTKGGCDLLIWTDEFKDNTIVGEEIQSSVGVGNESESVSAVAVEVMEAGMKKISKLQKKLNVERLRGDSERLKRKIATYFLVVSIVMNLIMCIKYVF